MELKIKGKILTIKSYEKKDKETNKPTGELGYSLKLYADYQIQDISKASVIDTFIGKKFKGNIDMSNFMPLQDVDVLVDFTLGSEFFDLIDIIPIVHNK